VVVAIDARRIHAAGSRSGAGAAGAAVGEAGPELRWEVLVKGGRHTTGLDAVAWAVRAAELGAGELLITSIDRDGTQSGYDTALLRAVTSRVTVPVIASGGAAGPSDFVAAISEGGADAVLAASIFHRRIHAIADVKRALQAAGIPVRATQGVAA
jgi:cyclase